MFSNIEHERRLNAIDLEATNLLLSTEKKCCKLRAGTVVYLLELSKLGLTWRFWRKLVQYKQRRFFDYEYIICTAIGLQVSHLLDLPVTKCIENLKFTKKQYLEAKSK